MAALGGKRPVGGSSGSEMVGIGASETEIEGMKGELISGPSLIWMEGGSGTLMLGMMGAEAVDSGM